MEATTPPWVNRDHNRHLISDLQPYELGMGGDHNGYYYDSNIYINRTDGIHDFDIDRKNLLFN